MKIIETVRSIKGEVQIELQYESEVKLRKGAPYGKVVRAGKYRGWLNRSARESAIKRLQDRDIKYLMPPPNARTWGERDKDVPSIIRHKEKEYLELVDVDTVEVRYLDEEGRELPKAEVEEWEYAGGGGQSLLHVRNFDVVRVKDFSIME